MIPKQKALGAMGTGGLSPRLARWDENDFFETIKKSHAWLPTFI